MRYQVMSTNNKALSVIYDTKRGATLGGLQFNHARANHLVTLLNEGDAMWEREGLTLQTATCKLRDMELHSGEYKASGGPLRPGRQPV